MVRCFGMANGGWFFAVGRSAGVCVFDRDASSGDSVGGTRRFESIGLAWGIGPMCGARAVFDGADVFGIRLCVAGGPFCSGWISLESAAAWFGLGATGPPGRALVWS